MKFWKLAPLGSSRCTYAGKDQLAGDTCVSFAILVLTCVRLRSRPKSVSEVAHQEEVVQTLQRALETANVRGPARSHCTACKRLCVHAPSVVCLHLQGAYCGLCPASRRWQYQTRRGQLQ